MVKEEEFVPPRQLTPRERMWIDNFQAHETPASLRLADDFVNLLNPDDKVLEVGCAFGRVAIFLSNRKDVLVTGIDINKAEIKWAKDAGSKFNKNEETNFEVMNGTQLSFDENEFDSVVMVGLLGGVELSVRKDLLKEAYRVVKPGGKIAVAEFKMNLTDSQQIKKYEEDMVITGEWGSRIIRRGTKILFIAKHFTEEELKTLLLDAGFESMESREQIIETVGIGDGEMKARQQYTVWGIKPIIGH